MIFEKIRSCLWKLEGRFWTYGWIRLLGPSCLNVVSRRQVPRAKHVFKFHNFIGFISWFLRKWGPVCENWNQGFGLMAGYVFYLLCPSSPNIVSMPEVQRLRHFFRFHNLIGFAWWFLRKGGPVCENSSQGSKLMAGYVVWAQVAQM